MGGRKKEISRDEVYKALQELVQLLNEGWSIIVAKKKVTGGGQNNALTRAMMKTDLYMFILNQYMTDRNYNCKFHVNEWGQIKGVKKPVSKKKTGPTKKTTNRSLLN